MPDTDAPAPYREYNPSLFSYHVAAFPSGHKPLLLRWICDRREGPVHPQHGLLFAGRHRRQGLVRQTEVSGVQDSAAVSVRGTGAAERNQDRPKKPRLERRGELIQVGNHCEPC